MLRKLLPVSVGIIAYIAAGYFATQAGIPEKKRPYFFCAIVCVYLLEQMIESVFNEDEK